MLPVVEGIVAAAARDGATPALINGSRTISYAELLDAIGRISNYFADSGARPGSKLFINIADPDLRLMATIAAMHCGLIPFAILEIGDLKDEVDYDYVVGAAALQSPEPRSDLTIGEAVLGGRLSDATLRTFPDVPDDAILFIGSTTGTTGRRRLVAATASFVRTMAASAAPGMEKTRPSLLRFKPGERGLSTIGDVSYAGVSATLQRLTGGATSVRMASDRRECAEQIGRFSVSQIWTTSGTLADFMDVMDRDGIECPSVRRIVLIGSLFDRALVVRVEEHFAAELLVGYGTSEIGRISSGVVTAADFEFGYVGRLSPGVKLVTTGTRANPAPLVVVHDPSTYTPYYQKGRIVPYADKFYTLPDLGFAEAGCLFLVGRDDEVFNINGNKTAYSLIDAALRAEPGVKDVAVVSAAPTGDPAGLIIGVVGAGPLDIPGLVLCVARTVKARQAAHRMHLFQLDAVPRNAFGKTDRDRVVAAYRQQPGGQRP